MRSSRAHQELRPHSLKGVRPFDSDASYSTVRAIMPVAVVVAEVCRLHVLFDAICGCLEGDRLRTRYGSSLLIAQRRTAS
jgi:hypothetical protein